VLDLWWRPTAGFELRNAVESRATWLVPKAPKRGDRFADPLAPRLAPSDVAVFARLKTEADVLTYASKHGWLGKPEQVPSLGGVMAESTEWWLEQVASVKQTLDLIERALRVSKAPSERDRRALQEAVQDAGLALNPTPGTRPRTTVAESALALAALRIESRLADLVAFRIRPQPHGTISYIPRNPLGAIYLELARQLTARTPRWHNCEYCGRPFLASRRDARFHSDTCRSNARHHRRKAK
jgi:hypothetical protein